MQDTRDDQGKSPLTAHWVMFGGTAAPSRTTDDRAGSQGDRAGMGGRGSGVGGLPGDRSRNVMEILGAKGRLQILPTPKGVVRRAAVLAPRLLIKNAPAGLTFGAARVLLGRWHV